MLKKFLLTLAIPVLAQAECVMTDRVTTASTVQIQERSGMRHDIVPSPHVGYRRCIVSFRAQINHEWHTAVGFYDWPGNTPDSQACDVARERADASVKTQVAPVGVRSESTMICTDQPNLETKRQVTVGTQGALHQFRPHPEYTREFWYNGTPCRWFMDTEWQHNDVQTRQGVICRLSASNWVVVDKF